MKEFLKVVLILILAVVILGAGYFIGHKVGKQYGAQQYVKLLWNNGELNISANLVMKKVNEYRVKNSLEPFQETTSLCDYAQFRAEEVMRKYTSSWNRELGQFDAMTKPDEMHQSDLSLEEAQKICTNCNFSSQRENIYSTAKPEHCISINAKSNIPCTGDELFSMVENHTDRVVRGWILSPGHNETLLIKNKYGCIASFGGVVVLETY